MRSRDYVRTAETYLAVKLADLHLLWEPGLDRNAMIEYAVDAALQYVYRMQVTFGPGWTVRP